MSKIFLLFISFLISFAIGSNDSSNALSVATGSGVIKLKRAIFLFGFMVFLGLLLNSQKIFETVGKELITPDYLLTAISLSLSAFFIILCNLKSFPISSHQIIIGSLIGTSIALKLKVSFKIFIKIFISWFISPAISLFFAFSLFMVFNRLFAPLSFFIKERIFYILIMLGTILISYNTGANELATVLAPVLTLPVFEAMPYFLKGIFFLSASLFTFLGSYLLSHRVIETVGKKITILDPFSGFTSQIATGLTIYFFTLLGMPVSTTYCLVGAITGVGLTRGKKGANLHLLKKMIFVWIFYFAGIIFVSLLFTRFFLFLKGQVL